MTASVDAEDKTVALNGLRFHYRDWGNAGAPPLVLLHGYTSHARSWDALARAFRERYRVLALDQRGHGETEWAPDYAPERMIEDLDAFVRALALGRVNLLGHSMGGRNAYLYAAQQPEAVARLVIIDIGPEIEPAGLARIVGGAQGVDVFADPEQAFRMARAANPRPPDELLRHRVVHNLMQRDDGSWSWRYDAALRAADRPLPNPEPEAGWALLPRIACPTLVVRGAASDVLGHATAERMVRAMPDCRLVEVPDAGHSVPLDNLPGLIEALNTFL